ncbi:TetR-like C-terminal domain-containing protein [Streptomyces sp. NPDC052023]|uniref:TetR-like C-terminal domain-containing protein n=1 Tax=Streptomyces sp. NPDC052023 TaxID=3365681 RepID=UPI0037D962B0
MSRSEQPVEQLASFASAYVRFAAEEPALFDITFHAGLDKSRYTELASAGDELAGLLLPAARRSTPDPDDAFDLLLRVAVTAHGLAVFLRQGLFGVGSGALTETEERAARTARDIARRQATLTS